jgi:AcrR family transcriptional regulator
LADIALLPAESGLYGLVASDPTVSRTIDRLAAATDRRASKRKAGVRACGRRKIFLAVGIGPGAAALEVYKTVSYSQDGRKEEQAMGTAAATTLKLDPVREQAILYATLEVLAETGYDALRLDAVAARAKASKATLYRHWTGKADLVGAAVRSYEQTDDLIEETDTGSLHGDLLAILRAITDTMTGPTGQIMTGVMIVMQRDSELAEAVRASIIKDRQHIIQRMLDRAIARGELPADTDTEIFEEIAPAVLFTRIFILGRPTDKTYLTRLADSILIPLMTRH